MSQGGADVLPCGYVTGCLWPIKGTDLKYLPVPFIQMDEVSWAKNRIGYAPSTCVWIITV